MFGMSEFSRKLWAKLRKKAYRRAFVEEHVRRGIASQIRAMRDDPTRQWNQGELSRRMNKPQSVVSRLEDPSYGKMTIQTLLEVAATFDVALIVKFVGFRRFLRETDDLTIESMQVENFDTEDASVARPPSWTFTRTPEEYVNQEPVIPAGVSHGWEISSLNSDEAVHSDNISGQQMVLGRATALAPSEQRLHQSESSPWQAKYQSHQFCSKDQHRIE
jgi:hypothetical protein